MLEIILLVYFSMKIRVLCSTAGLPAGRHIFYFLAYWIVAEAITASAAILLGADLYSGVLIAFASACIAGYLAYRQIRNKAFEQIRKNHGQDPQE